LIKNDDTEGRILLKRVYVLLAFLAAILIAVPFAEPISYVLGTVLNRPGNAVQLPSRPPPHDRVEARRQDVADLALLLEYDRSFSPEAKAAFQQNIQALNGEAATMSDAVFEMAVSRLVALAGNAHTTVSRIQRASAFRRVPLRLAWFSDGLYVVRAKAPVENLIGRRVVSIDGRPVEQAVAELRPYLSGTAEHARADSPPVLECPALLQAVWPDTDGIHLAIGLDDGVIEPMAAVAPAPDPFALRPVMVVGPGTLGDWNSVLGYTPALPLSLRAPERMAFSAPLDRNGVYIRINGNEDDDNGPLAAQLAVIGAAKPIGGWRWIVLDLRFNHGGFEMKTVDFTRSLPRLLVPDGNLWILTGNTTFSAAIITAARAKYFLGLRAHIVGEAMGDRNPFWTDGGPPLVLRNSGIAIGHAFFKQDWANGCHEPTLCNPLQWLYGVAAGDLTPEVNIGWSFADYVAGRDTVMERALALSR
jgi:hypothetical protein